MTIEIGKGLLSVSFTPSVLPASLVPPQADSIIDASSTVLIPNATFCFFIVIPLRNEMLFKT